MSMGNRRKLSAFISVILLSPVSAHAGVWRDLGGESCGSFLAAVAGNALAQTRTMKWEGATYYDKSYGYSQWVQGYLTAVSTGMNVNVLDTVDYAGIDLWLRKWCDKHPTENLVLGLQALIEEKLKSQ
jgi:hypothetical protein